MHQTSFDTAFPVEFKPGRQVGNYIYRFVICCLIDFSRHATNVRLRVGLPLVFTLEVEKPSGIRVGLPKSLGWVLIFWGLEIIKISGGFQPLYDIYFTR